MRTLFEIIKYLFPKSKWEVIQEMDVYRSEYSCAPCERKYVLRDQFGNMKKFIA
jgi:hypothetical protein